MLVSEPSSPTGFKKRRFERCSKSHKEGFPIEIVLIVSPD